MHTMVAVRLSINELRKKASTQTMGIKRPGFSLVQRTMKRVTTAKPFMWSMDSTRHIAGRRNKITFPTSSKPLPNSELNSSCPSSERSGWQKAAWYVHITEAKTSMMADLSSRTTSSKATRMIPVRKRAARIFLCTVSSSITVLGQPKKEKRKMITNKARPAIFVTRRVVVWACFRALSPVQCICTGSTGLIARSSPNATTRAIVLSVMGLALRTGELMKYS
mmetsp:Transcript_53596/g.85402  ORF Transcript_53596/g.85402 Transcript_53596/m.85402 type:complete len:222 (-) Transcript_53596:8-673(-)